MLYLLHLIHQKDAEDKMLEIVYSRGMWEPDPSLHKYTPPLCHTGHCQTLV